MYSVLDYGRMACDGVRMDAYARAIARTVKPGSVVVDLGAGTGIFSLLAARAGARRVHAIEPNPAIWLLPELAAENGVADRITIHHRSSLEVSLDERADVIVSDLRGTSPLMGDHVALLRDARERLLAPTGVVLPERDELFVAVVENEELFAAIARGWKPFERHGLASSAVRTSITNTVFDDRERSLLTSDVLSTEAAWGLLDYRICDGSPLERTVDLAFTRAGTAHGLAIWFEATVTEDIRYSTAPGSRLTYARTYLPLTAPVAVRRGDSARVTVRADVRGSRWAWDTRILDADAAGGAAAATKADFRQSTFFGAPTSAADLLRQSTSARPVRSPHGEFARHVLDAMDGTRTVRELADGAPKPAGAKAARASTDLLDEVREIVARYAR
jgi:protein arginine N-methyltransferase 1